MMHSYYINRPRTRHIEAQRLLEEMDQPLESINPPVIILEIRDIDLYDTIPVVKKPIIYGPEVKRKKGKVKKW